MRIQPWLMLRTRYVRREVLILYRQKYHRNSQMACAVLIIPRQNSLADASLLMEYRGTDPMFLPPPCLVSLLLPFLLRSAPPEK